MIMNITTYGLTLVAARALGPEDFGEFSAVLGALIILNVLSLGLQSTAARRIAHHPGAQAETTQQVLRVTLLCAVGVGAIGAALAPLTARVLELQSPLTAVALAIAAALLTVMGGVAGVLQGEERWLPLGLVYTSMGVSRLLVGIGAMLIASTALSLAAAVAAAAAVPVAVGFTALRRTGTVGARSPEGAEPDDRPEHSLWREVAHNSHALLAFFTLSNMDIVVARSLIPDGEAGLYAAGLILTKAVLFFPQFVVVVAFPKMAKRAAGRRTDILGLSVVGLLGLCATTMVALALPLALEFVGGGQYHEIERSLPLFAMVGTVLAMTQLLVYSAIAGRHPRAVWLLWAGALAFLALATTADTAVELLHSKLALDVGLLLVLAGYVLTAPKPEVEAHTYDPVLIEDTASPEQPPVR